MTIQPTRIQGVNFESGLSSFLRNFDAARQQVREDEIINARKEAGGLAANGDLRGASGAAFAAGDISGGSRLLGVLRQGERDQAADARDARNFQFQQSRAAAQDARANEGLDLRKQQAAAASDFRNRQLSLSEGRARASANRPSSKIGKLASDLKRGLITEEQFKAATSAMGAPGLRIGPDGRLINVGQPLTKSTKTTLQKEQAGDRLLLRNLNAIEKKFDPSFLTFKGGLAAETARVGEKLSDVPVVGDLVAPGKESKAFLKRRTGFVNEVEQTFNQYRKLITGAAAAVAELDRLQRSFLSKEMSPTEFQSALGTLKEKTARAINERNALLQEGIPLDSEEAKARIDQAVSGGGAFSGSSPLSGQTSSGIKFTVE